MTKEKSIDIATQAGIVERGMEAYKAAKECDWVGLSDERLMEMPKQEQGELVYDLLDDARAVLEVIVHDQPDDTFSDARDLIPKLREQLGLPTIINFTTPQFRKPMTDEQKAKVARMFSDRISNECNINADDHWKYHSESVLDDINFILQAAQEIKE